MDDFFIYLYTHLQDRVVQFRHSDTLPDYSDNQVLSAGTKLIMHGIDLALPFSVDHKSIFYQAIYIYKQFFAIYITYTYICGAKDSVANFMALL